jgi:hypothetical protein
MSNESENKAFEEMMNDQPAGVYELAQGLTAEEMVAVFFNTDALVEQPEMVYRLKGGKHRYYYTFNEAQEPVFFTSVTTMIKQTMPTSPHLIKWIADMGYEESRNYAQERADYGTFMHTEIAELLIARKYDTGTLKEKLKAFIEAEKLPVDFINHADELKKDILAFAQFMIDCKVKPLAIEIVLTHPTDGYAGAIDLVCEMTQEVKGYWGETYKSGVNKGKPKATKKEQTFIAIVDFKSGRKGFYEEHEIQLQAYTEMWQHHFPNKQVERVFNWSPKDWRGATPTYNLKDQTEAKSRNKLQYLVELARIESDKRINTVTIVEGVINLDAGLDNNVVEMTLSELVKKRKTDNEKPVK